MIQAMISKEPLMGGRLLVPSPSEIY